VNERKKKKKIMLEPFYEPLPKNPNLLVKKREYELVGGKYDNQINNLQKEIIQIENEQIEYAGNNQIQIKLEQQLKKLTQDLDKFKVLAKIEEWEKKLQSLETDTSIDQDKKDRIKAMAKKAIENLKNQQAKLDEESEVVVPTQRKRAETMGKEEEEEIKKKPKLSNNDRVIIRFLENQFEDLCDRYLQPFYRFIEMLSVESQIYYRYDKNLTLKQKKTCIVYGCKTKEEFIQKNWHLGNDILNWVKDVFETTELTKASIELIGAGEERRKQQPKKKKTTKKIIEEVEEEEEEEEEEFIEVEQQESKEEIPVLIHKELRPEWFQNEIEKGTPIYHFLLQNATFGALELAAQELKFPLQDLINSPQVAYMFAQFCAVKYIRPKHNAYASTTQGNEVQYRISSGVYTGQQQSKWLMGCKEWFKDVYYKPESEETRSALIQLQNREKELQIQSRVLIEENKIKTAETKEIFKTKKYTISNEWKDKNILRYDVYQEYITTGKYDTETTDFLNDFARDIYLLYEIENELMESKKNQLHIKTTGQRVELFKK
jgi:hypothetical protein